MAAVYSGGRRSARVSLRLSSGLATVAAVTLAFPAQSQTNTIPAQSGPYLGIYEGGDSPPKAPRGNDACGICSPAGSSDGPDGTHGGDAPVTDYTFASGVDVYGQTGQVSVTIANTGGKGGDGGDGGALNDLKWGYANGGAGAQGGTGGTVTFEQQGGANSQITGADRGAVLLQGTGGAGGMGGYTDNGNTDGYGHGGAGGNGGTGAAINFTQDVGAAINSAQAGVTAIQLLSTGGNGGTAPDARSHTDHAYGQRGGNGGNGGGINALIWGTVSSAGSGVVGISQGANGGQGGFAHSDTGPSTGGQGGDGGGGGSVSLVNVGTIKATGAAAPATGSTINKNADSSVTFSAPTAAMQALVIGGQGGRGNGSGGNFLKGTGGSGGGVTNNSNATVHNSTGTVSTTGYMSAAMVAQSIGGFGGNGSYGGGVFVASGGLGATGGSGGEAYAQTYQGPVTTEGDDSPALLAQSIGGGGGRGGDAQVKGIIFDLAVGGDSGDGGNGGQAQVVNGDRDSGSDPWTNGSLVHTLGDGSHAMFAQSVGGGGGTAGDANAFTAGVFAMAIGGKAGTGGIGGIAEGDNSGVVQTEGVGSYGLIAQSVGGGGGHGGAANSFTGGVQITAAISIGGNGGSGGLGGTATLGNTGQIVTNGASSFGMVAQSVGGGGGTGGTSTATTFQVYNDDEYPSVDLNTSIGGVGGTGGVGSAVSATNSGALLTSGEGSLGILAQSVGGGGGDASSFNQSFKSSTINATATVGGNGGSGGNAGTVYVGNTGLINTAGNEASAIYAQAVGGGGGNGGTGQADTGSFEENETSIQMTVAVGGAGGAGGDGNSVTVENGVTGIITYGDKSNGIFAQSVGGGGGDGGGAVAKGGGGENNINVAVGGNSGRDQHNNVIKGGGDGKLVSVTNDAVILTGGSDSAAIYAQSVGGGGGRAGSATVGNGSSPQVNLADMIARGMGVNEDVIELGNGLYELREKGGAAWGDVTKAKNAFNHYTQEEKEHSTPTEDGEAEEGSEINVNIGGGVAGTGGAGGAGGEVDVTNTGYIETDGPASEGIFAQSVGGGGGDGGGATSANGTAVISGSFGVGGSGGASGNGGTVTVTNSGSIVTEGDLSHGIFSQSIGAGGGTGGASSGESGAFSLLSFNMGGDGGANGSGGAVTVNDTNGVIQTNGDDAIGIVAQSIGGGGGLAAAMEENEDEETNGGEAESETGLIPDSTLIPITLSGSDSGTTSGDGGAVTLNLNGTRITTQGTDSYGILAQSIGGGGGLVLGVDGEADQNFFGNTNVSGNGGNVTLNVGANTVIETHGDGAAGILAQSIGGAGGLVGGLSMVDLTTATRIQDKSSLHHGTGGDVTINMDVDAGISITTHGKRAHGIFAQAAGGGAGIFGLQGEGGTTEVGYFSAAGGRAPVAGKVTINANGWISAQGEESWGIWAQSRGNANSAVEINFVDGGIYGKAGGIYIENPTSTNTIFADGYLSAGETGIAISTNGSGVLNAGRGGGGIVSIAGDILSSGGGWNITNNVSNRLYTAREGTTTYQSNAFVNHGEIWVGTNATRTTHITSNLTSDGRIIVGVDFTGGTSDVLQVDGTATIAGQILVNPMNLPTSGDAGAYIINAGSLNLAGAQAYDFTHNTDDSLTAVMPYLHTYYLEEVGNRLLIYAEANFASIAAPSVGGFNDNQSSLANHLQALYDGGSDTGGADLVTALFSEVDNAEEYQAALDSLGPHMLGLAAATRGQADRKFTASLLSCPSFPEGSVTPQEESCFWARAGGGAMNTDSNGEATGFYTESFAYQIGGQKEFGDGWFVGASVAYEDTDARSDGEPATLKGDALLAGISLKRQAGPLIASAAVTGGLGWFDSSRSITIGSDVSTATASPDTKHFGGHIKLSYDLAAGSFYIRPQVALDATYIDFEEFTEEGSPFAMEVDGNSNWILSAAPALEIGTHLSSGAGFFRPYIRGGALFYDERDWSVEARLAGSSDTVSPFRADTSLPETAAQVALGMEVVSGRGFEARIEYGGEFAKNFDDHSGLVRVGYRF